MRWYSGIDLHSNNSVVVVIDDGDRIVYRRRLPNELAKVLEALEPFRGELSGVAVESTFNWYWLVDGLQAAGHRVHLANPAKMKRYEGLKHAGDESDAYQLAHLLRLGILPTGYIYPRAQRALRDLGRRRMQLVRSRTVQILAVENVQARETGARMTGQEVKRLNARMVEELGLLPEVALGVQANVAVIATLNAEPPSPYSNSASAPILLRMLPLPELLGTYVKPNSSVQRRIAPKAQRTLSRSPSTLRPAASTAVSATRHQPVTLRSMSLELDR